MTTIHPDAIALLKADHRKAEDLFAQFESARRSDQRQKLVKQICTELTIHTIIEEEIFYPACRNKIEEGTYKEAHVEHDGVKVLVAELEACDPNDDFYDAKVKVLSENVKHHVHEEEMRSEGMFAQARAAGLDMADLADRLEKRKRELIAHFETDGLPAPETRTFTTHILPQSIPVGEPSRL